MEKYNMNELEIKFNMVKSNGKDFTDNEIDEFNNEFIDLVEKHNYLVAGSIFPYDEDLDDCLDIDIDEFDSYNVDDEKGEDWEPSISDDFQIGSDGAFEFDEEIHKPKKRKK